MNLIFLTLYGVFVGYLSFTAIGIPVKYLPWFKEHFNLVDDKLLITRENFNRVQILHYALLSCMLMLVMQCYGAGERLFPAYGMLSFPIFGFLGQVKGMQFSVTPNFWRGLSPLAKRTVVGLLLFFTFFTSYQCYLAWVANDIITYLGIVILIPTLYIATFKFYLPIGQANWHIHHWFIGYYGALISRYDTPVSNFVFSVLWGIFLEGVMTYGVLPIMYDVNNSTKSTVVDCTPILKKNTDKFKESGSLNLAQIVERQGWGKITNLDQFSITCGDMHIIWPMHKYCKTEAENQYIKGFYDALCGKTWSKHDSQDYIRGHLDSFNEEYQNLISPMGSLPNKL